MSDFVLWYGVIGFVYSMRAAWRLGDMLLPVGTHIAFIVFAFVAWPWVIMTELRTFWESP